MIAGGQRYLELVRKRQIEPTRFGPLPNAPFETDFSDLDSSYEFSSDLEFEEAARIHDTQVLSKIPVYLDRLAAADSRSADSILLDMYTLLSLVATLRKRDPNLLAWRKIAIQRVSFDFEAARSLPDEHLREAARLACIEVPPLIESYRGRF